MCGFNGCETHADFGSVVLSILILSLILWVSHRFGDEIESALKALYKRIPVFDLWG